MPKIPLSTITSGYGTVDALIANFDAIEAAFDNTLSRDGDTPNQMQANLDMNGFNILNQGNPVTVEGFNWEGQWLTATTYQVGDVVQQIGSAYICVVAHTSGVFATDLSAFRWQLVVQANLPTQTGNSGKYLTSNGTSASWDDVKYTPLGTGAVQRTVTSKVQEIVSVKDFGAVGDGLANDTTAFTNAKTAAAILDKAIFVPQGNYLNGKPSGVVGDNVLWNYYDGGDSDNVLNINGDRGGFFSDYDCQATQIVIGQFDEDQSSVSGGGYRDLIFFDVVDSDTTNYTAIGQKVTHAIRAYAHGAYSGGGYQSQYKDIVGGNFVALGNIQWANRGVSALAVDAYQFGIGIASNEFAVHNPAAASGGVSQSLSMAAVQAIVRSRFGDDDSTHLSRGVYICNNGLRITSGIDIISDTSEGFTSHYRFGISMLAATVSQAAIRMPLSASGTVGTIIEYDPNDYSFYDRGNNRFGWSIAGNVNFFIGSAGVGVGAAPVAATRMFINASTASQSHLQLFPGVTPTSPNNGELWFDGSNVKIRVGGVTKTFTLI